MVTHDLHADIGAFTRLSVQVEDASGKAQWHLACVEVQNQKTGQRGLFVGRQWISSSSSTTLLPSDSTELDDVEYEVRAGDLPVEDCAVVQLGDLHAFAARCHCPEDCIVCRL